MIELPLLRPFQSYVFLRLSNEEDERVVVSEILRESIDYLLREGLHLEDVSAVEADDLTTIAAAYFSEERPPSWTNAARPLDYCNHLLVIAQLGRMCAIHLSDRGWRDSLVRLIRDARIGAARGLELVEAGIMNAAFGVGRTRTLWLAGTHARSTIKSDSKVVSGVDLRDALDPLSDQTYHFTAARCEPESLTLKSTIGFSPYEATVWVTRSATWGQFIEVTSELLLHLAITTDPIDAPIPILSIPLTRAGQIERAFDVSLIPPEFQWDGAGDVPEVRELHERWAFGSYFEVTSTDGPNLTADVYLEGDKQGELILTFANDDPRKVVCHAYGEPVDPAHAEHIEQACRFAENQKWLTVRYESGHTLVGKTLFRTRFRDVSFDQFEWEPFANVIITQEKPASWNQIGQDNSLFCWLWENWPVGAAAENRGWLACDDAANEIADFVHLDPTSRTISLIHAKASGNASPARQVSVSKFEVVVSQAVKNLRFLDRLLLEGGLREGCERQVGNLVLNCGRPSTRDAMIEAIAAIGTSFKRRVVILQPHLRHEQWNAARAAPDTVDGHRLRQLNTLLVEAENACKGLNARLTVIGEA
jgi:hypothetical protein